MFIQGTVVQEMKVNGEAVGRSVERKILIRLDEILLIEEGLPDNPSCKTVIQLKDRRMVEIKEEFSKFHKRLDRALEEFC